MTTANGSAFAKPQREREMKVRLLELLNYPENPELKSADYTDYADFFLGSNTAPQGDTTTRRYGDSAIATKWHDDKHGCALNALPTPRTRGAIPTMANTPVLHHSARQDSRTKAPHEDAQN
jgi:hypothetical protein